MNQHETEEDMDEKVNGTLASFGHPLLGLNGLWPLQGHQGQVLKKRLLSSCLITDRNLQIEGVQQSLTGRANF